MKRFLVLIVTFAALLAVYVVEGQTYPPELRGVQFVQEPTAVATILDRFDAPISLPPALCTILQGTLESDGINARIGFDRAWSCEWVFSGELRPENREFLWSSTMGAYVWWAPGGGQCFKAIVYHEEENLEFIEGCLIFDGHCCPWWDFGSTVFFWVIEPWPEKVPGYISSGNRERRR